MGRQYDEVVEYHGVLQDRAFGGGYIAAHRGNIDNFNNGYRTNNPITQMVSEGRWLDATLVPRCPSASRCRVGICACRGFPSVLRAILEGPAMKKRSASYNGCAISFSF